MGKGIGLPGGVDKSTGHGATTVRDNQLLVSNPETPLTNNAHARAFVDRAYEDGRRRKSQLERNWHENIQFYMGNQYVVWEGRGEEAHLRTPRSLEHRVRYKANMVATYVMTRSAKLLKEKPFIHVNPATGESEDATIAQGSTRVMRYFWQKEKVQGTVLPQVTTDLLLFGTGILKAFFDPTSGPLASLTSEDNELVGEELAAELGPDPEDRSFAIGEAKMQAVSPFHVYPDPSADDWDDVAWLIEARRMSKDQAIDFWGKQMDDVVADGDAEDQPEYFRDLIRGWTGKARGSRSTTDRPVPTVMVKECWIKPCRTHPAGRHIVVVGSKVMTNEPLPGWAGGELPYVFMSDKFTPHRLWSVPITDDLRDINKARNRAISQIIENANLVGDPPVRVPVGARMKAEEIQSSGPGKVWKYVPSSGSHKPEFVQPPELPGYVQGIPDRLEADAMFVTGMNEPTMKSSAPSNVRTASGLAALMKQDESRQAVMTQNFQEALSSAASKVLRIIASEYEEERIGKIVGDKGDVFHFPFTGQSLKGKNAEKIGANYFDVEIRVDTGHRSKDSQQQFILQAVQLGLINVGNEKERLWALRTLDAGAPDDDLFGRVGSKEAQARTENQWMADLPDEAFEEKVSEGLIGPHPWDDHEAHISAHREFQQLAQFLDLPREVRLRFDQHVADHERIMQEQIAAQQAQMAPMQQAPASPEGPPPGQPGSDSGTPSMSSMSGMPEEPKIPQPPDLGHTPFAGLDL